MCANTIPPERREFLERYGIECKDLGISKITDLAQKYGYRFLDDKEPPIETKKHPIYDDTSVWIFQTNPARYDSLNAFSDPLVGDVIHWLVQQHRNKIKKGHTGLIWLSGKEAGIYGVTELIFDPAMMMKPPEEDRYWLEREDRNIQKLRVKMKITKKLLNRPLFRNQLLQTDGLKSLSILRFSQGTNFPVRKAEWEIISKLVYL